MSRYRQMEMFPISNIGYYICVPFAWLLRLFYSVTGSYGFAIILFSLAVKLILLPFQYKSKKSMMRMNRLQPKMKEIQTKYANNRMLMSQEINNLYMEEGVNPMSGCLWSFLPLPIVLALYSIIRQPISRFMLLSAGVAEEVRAFAETMGYVASTGVGGGYEEIKLAEFISAHFDAFSGKFKDVIRLDYQFLGVDLSSIPWNHRVEILSGGWPVIGLMLIPVISTALNFLQTRISMSSAPSADENAARSNRSMTLMMPLLSLYMGLILPAALGIYWIANSFFTIIQESILTKYFQREMEAEEKEREERRRAERLQRVEQARIEEKKREEEEKSGKKPRKEPKKEKTEKKNSTTDNGRIGERPYARGRSFDASHYEE